ncbi:MAG: tyrosine-type recombinase/integrase [Bryobacteraceae bacterium]
MAASIRRVKGPKKLGVRLGNWLTAEEARRFWQSPDPQTLKGKRDRAIVATLLGCGLHRRELADLDFKHLQQREEHWAIVDLVGKGGHIRTVPMPEWVKTILDEWVHAAELQSGRIFRCVCRAGKCWGDDITQIALPLRQNHLGEKRASVQSPQPRLYGQEDWGQSLLGTAPSVLQRRFDSYRMQPIVRTYIEKLAAIWTPACKPGAIPGYLPSFPEEPRRRRWFK